MLRQPTNLCDLVERALQTLPPPEGVRAVVEHVIEDPTAEVDRDQIGQVLTNLITNAYDAMPGGGMLTLRTTGREDDVSFEVTDTGCGIPESNLSKIFEPFFTTKQMGKGTGLGLAVTYGIVKMHTGSIEVTSNPGGGDGPKGTTFTVTLPRQVLHG